MLYLLYKGLLEIELYKYKLLLLKLLKYGMDKYYHLNQKITTIEDLCQVNQDLIEILWYYIMLYSHWSKPGRIRRN